MKTKCLFLLLLLPQVFLSTNKIAESINVEERSSGIVADDTASPSSIKVEPSTSMEDEMNNEDNLLLQGDRIVVISRDCNPSSVTTHQSSDPCDSDPVFPEIYLGNEFIVGKRFANGATGALLELSDEFGMRRDIVVKYLFGERGKKLDEDTANEAKYYSLCIAMKLNCPKAMLVRVRVTRMGQEPYECNVIFKDYLRNARDMSHPGWCNIPEVRKQLEFELQKIMTYATYPGDQFQVECDEKQLSDRVCSNLHDLRNSKLNGYGNFPFILTDLKEANWMYVAFV